MKSLKEKLIEEALILAETRSIIDVARQLTMHLPVETLRGLAAQWIVDRHGYEKRLREAHAARRAAEKAAENARDETRAARARLKSLGVEPTPPPPPRPEPTPEQREEQRAHFRELEHKAEAEYAAHQAKTIAAITRVINDFKAEVRAEWTAELMARTFTLPDGERTTWAEATAEQHRCMAMTLQN